jgi:hypothetical protein
MSDGAGMSQAAIDKIVSERIADYKAQRDEARAAIKERDDAIASLRSEYAKLEKVAGKAPEFEAQIAALQTELEGTRAGYEREKAFMTVLGPEYDPDLAELIALKHSRIQGDDRPPLADYLKAQAADESSLVARFVTAKAPAAEPPPQAPPTPNRGALPSRTPAAQSGSVVEMGAAQWQEIRAKAGLAPKTA